VGSRANYVVVDDWGWRLYYSHWGAQSVDVQLAAGPGYARQFITSQQERDRESGWLDDVWCEGGAAVDFARCRLTFFGGSEFLHELNYRRAYFALLEQTWPGWSARWAYDGLADVAACVGVDATTIRIPPDPSTLDTSPTLVPATDEDTDTGYWALLTARTDEDMIVGWQITSLCVDRPVVWIGPGLLDLLPDPTVTGPADLAGQPPRWGVHVDHPARQVSWWATAESPGLQAQTPHRWPGWDVRFWQDRYEDHRAACGDLLRPPGIDCRQGFDDLTGRLLAEYRDPGARALHVVDTLREEGHTVEVTAPITAHVHLDHDDQQRQQITAAIAAARGQANV
jgi:hypothetical protein